MGRGKIDIKRIENANSRQVTFSKRRAGLLKKANELSILCDAEVAVIIFSHTGKAFEFTSHGMKKTLCRYNKCVNTPEAPVVELKTEKQEAEEVGSLREEIAKLKVEQMRLLGKDLHGASLKELQLLELQINEGLLSVKKKKEQLLLEQLEQSRIQEQRAMLENETLSKQVQELQEFLPPSERPVQAYLEYYPAMTNSPVKQATVSSDTICDFEADNDNSDTTLQLGLPSEVSQKQNTGSFDSWRCRM